MSNRDQIITIAKKLGVPYDEASGADNLAISCPLAPWTHHKRKPANGSSITFVTDRVGRKDRRPSCSVKIAEGAPSPWYCFACGSRGSGLSQLLRDLSIRGHVVADDFRQYVASTEVNADGTVNRAAQRPREPGNLRVPPSYIDYEELALTCPKHFVPVPDNHWYLRSRGVMKRTADDWGILLDHGDTPDSHGVERLVIPLYLYTQQYVGYVARVCARGKVAGSPYYNTPKLPRRSLLAGEHMIDLAHAIVVCEGLFDAIKVYQAGFWAVALLGAQPSESQIEKLAQLGSVVLFLDSDDAGVTAAGRIRARLQSMGRNVEVVVPTGEAKDPGGMSSADIQRLLRGKASSRLGVGCFDGPLR